MSKALVAKLRERQQQLSKFFDFLLGVAAANPEPATLDRIERLLVELERNDERYRTALMDEIFRKSRRPSGLGWPPPAGSA